MQKKYLPKIKAQILVVVLIALSILSIFVVVVASNARRDAQQTIQNKQYEQAVTVGEEVLLTAIDQLSNLVDLGCNDLGGGTTWNCKIKPEEGEGEILSQNEIVVDLTIDNQVREIKNYSLQKDKNLSVVLNGFDDQLNVSWTNNASWIITLDYIVNGTNQYGSIKDIYDDEDINLFPPTAVHSCFNFSSGNTSSFEINLRTANLCLPANTNLLEIRFKPLMNTSSGATLLSVSDDAGALPPQAIVYFVKAYSAAVVEVEEDQNVPIAELEAVVPLNSTSMELLDYVFRSEQDLNK